MAFFARRSPEEVRGTVLLRILVHQLAMPRFFVELNLVEPLYMWFFDFSDPQSERNTEYFAVEVDPVYTRP